MLVTGLSVLVALGAWGLVAAWLADVDRTPVVVLGAEPEQHIEAGPTPTPSAPPTATPHPEPSPSPRPTEGPTTEMPDDRRAVTPDEPLRVLVAGDSMWEQAGPTLANRLEGTGRATTHVDVRYSSGFTRPDFLDWHAHAASLLATHDPDVVVFMVGANDSQPLVDAGTRHLPGSDGFSKGYRSRTQQLLARLTSDERHVVWVGLPVMRDPGYDARMQVVSHLHAQVVRPAPRAAFVPTRTLFADPEGGYAALLPNDEGLLVPMRGADGIHLSHDGAHRLSDHLFDLLDDDWSLR